MMTTGNPALWVGHATGVAHSPMHTFGTLFHLIAKQFCEVSMVPFIELWERLFRRHWVAQKMREFQSTLQNLYLYYSMLQGSGFSLSFLTSTIPVSNSGFPQWPQRSRFYPCECNTTARTPGLLFSYHKRERWSCSFNYSNVRDWNHLLETPINIFLHPFISVWVTSFSMVQSECLRNGILLWRI